MARQLETLPSARMRVKLVLELGHFAADPLHIGGGMIGRTGKAAEFGYFALERGNLPKAVAGLFSSGSRRPGLILLQTDLLFFQTALSGASAQPPKALAGKQALLSFLLFVDFFHEAISLRLPLSTATSTYFSATCSLQNRDGIGSADFADTVDKIRIGANRSRSFERRFRAVGLHKFESNAAFARTARE